MNTDAFSYRPIEFRSRGTENTVLQCAWRVESLILKCVSCPDDNNLLLRVSYFLTLVLNLSLQFTPSFYFIQSMPSVLAVIYL